MLGICGGCGKAIVPGARFCSNCGWQVPAETAPVAPASLAGIEAQKGSRTNPAVIGGVIAGILVVAAGLGLWLARDATGDLVPAVEATTEAAIDPNAPRPQEWFDTYSDKFVSAEIERITTSAGQKRNFPTAKGSVVLDTIPRGTILSGRWVEGGDPATRWLKTRDGGYVWEGNLGDPQAISALGMAGFQAGTTFASVRSRLDTSGRYGAQDYTWDANACEIYASNDQLVDVMVIEGKVTRVETASERLETDSGLRVGSTERQLLRTYAGKLKRQENPYAGVDYFYWAGKDSGIKFHVEDGRVTGITAGDSTISYVEGCL